MAQTATGRRGSQDLLHNDLQSVTESMHSELAGISQLMHDTGLKATLMSGSGPTLFGITEPDEVDNIKRRLPRELNIVVARPVRRGIVLHSISLPGPSS